MNRKERRMNEKLMKVIYNSSPNMIHEKKYVPKNCVFCDVKMKSIHDTHNPYPLADKIVHAKESNKSKTPDRCCSACNERVLAKRISFFAKLPKSCFVNAA